MKDSAVLPIFPSITDAVKWSADGDIAIACDDRVELLVS
jgi:hypothetical protein